MDVRHIIEPERHGLWIAVGFIITIVTFVMALVALLRIDSTFLMVQTQVLTLNQKIEEMKAEKAKQPASAAQPAAAPAPAVPAK